MQVIFHHRRDKTKSRGGATVAMLTDEDKNVLSWAVALCHPKDNFCKHTGRMKAAGRLRSAWQNHPLTVPVPLPVFLENVPTLLRELVR